MGYLYKALVSVIAAWGVFLTGQVQAQNVAHFNSAELRAMGANTIALTLHVNWPQVLHQALAPQMQFRDFLKKYSEYSDIQLGKEMTRLGGSLTRGAYLGLPSGARLNFKEWQFPSIPALRECLKISLMLIDMPTHAQAHLDPVTVSAEAHSKNALAQVQIQLPKALYPILVNSKNDNFWLTEQIPLAVISF